MKTRRPFVFDALLAFGFGGRGRVRVRVIRPGPDRPTVVILTELPGHGPTVTDFVDQLANTVARDHSLDTDCVLWIEHILATPIAPEQLRAVTFRVDQAGRLCRPAWYPTTRANLEATIRGRLED
jgi:hypothetical protein